MLKKNFSKFIVYLIVIIHVCIVIFPFIWLIYSSMKTNSEFFSSVWKLPSHLNFDNYIKAWGEGALGIYSINSILVTLVSVFITVIIANLAGYALVAYKVKWSSAIVFTLIAVMAIPSYTTLVPLSTSLKSVGLLNTRMGLILPTIAFNIPMSIFIMRGFFITVPKELIEAARIDGAGELKIFFKIMLPLAKSASFTTAIINVIWVWNDFLFPLVIINDPKLKTLPIGLRDFVGQHVTNYPVMLAAILISALPALLIYILFQKQVIGGLMGSAVKG
ncbi:MAG: raffinose/stachyose/melibiose transport system permease protein [Oceanotoga sp.]|uniref:carbohydrate ABC transporter permease n=1 Tax=Oceanotoga sp. TaxID=2108366 RepID=UPI00264FB21A|nr:carbohydrate ABC transporter permease [Oceanotoga sp.]MDN5343050.1 raffinose/stachyose/melibiose transport system permease protein [Oceanotoga sp.]